MNIENKNNLWSRFLNGDDIAYAQIYENYSQVLYAYGMCFTSNSSLVEDAIQDVFIKIYQNRENIGTTNNVKLYLFVALKHTLYNLFRKNKIQVNLDNNEPLFALNYTVEDIMIEDEEAKERMTKIKEMLDELTSKQKEIIYYRYIEEMSFDEISKLLEINNQSVQNLLHRALKKLRATFGDSQELISVFAFMYFSLK